MADLSFDDLIPPAKGGSPKPSTKPTSRPTPSPTVSFDDLVASAPKRRAPVRTNNYFADVAANAGPDFDRMTEGLRKFASNPGGALSAIGGVAKGAIQNIREMSAPEFRGSAPPLATPQQQLAARATGSALRQLPSDAARAADATARGVVQRVREKSAPEFRGSAPPLATQREKEAASTFVRPFVHPIESFREKPLSTPMAWSAPLTLGGSALKSVPLSAAKAAGRAMEIAGDVTDPLGLALRGVGAGIDAAKSRLPPPAPKPIGADLKAVREAAARQDIAVPTTMVSPTARFVSDVAPVNVGFNPVRTAEQAIEPALGERIAGIAAEKGRLEPSDAALGSRIQKDAAAWSEAMRDKGSKLYKEASDLSSLVRIEPSNTGKFIDEELGRLSETPDANGPAIRVLSGVYDDLTNPNNSWSLDSMRGIRTGLFGKLSAADVGLTPSQKGALVDKLWSNMTKDIEENLTVASANGEPNAAKALTKLQEANATWAERSDTIKRVLSKVLGKNENDILEVGQDVWGADLRPEGAVEAIKRFSASDERALRKIMATVTPDTADAIRVSEINGLGSNSRGEFSALRFLSNFNEIPENSRKLLFGPQTTAALEDLKAISEGVLYRKRNQGGFGAKFAKGILTVGGLGSAVATGGASTAVLAAGASALGAQMLASPTAARWMVKLIKASESGQEAVGKIVTQMGTAALKDPAVSSLRKLAQQVALNPDAYVETEESVEPKDAASDDPFAYMDDLSDEELAKLVGDAPQDVVVKAIEGVEGGPNAGANLAGTSSATGPGQFTKDTFLATYKAAFPDSGMSDDEIKALHGTPEGDKVQHETLLPLLTDQNAKSLESDGFDITPASLYLAHFLGAVGAKRLLAADPSAAVEEIVSPSAVEANRSVLQGKTVADVLEWAARKMAEYGAQG